MKIKIHVTKEMYRRSMMCGMTEHAVVGTNCAIALAVRKIAPRALVSDAVILWDSDFLINGHFVAVPERDTSILPIEATIMIRRFDGASPIERLSLPEFSFEVDFPDALVEKIGIEEVKEILRKSETLELASPPQL